MAYTETDGINAFLARTLWLKRPVVREPLEGLVNGTNVIFSIRTPPALTGTITLIDSTGASVTPSSVSEASGSVVLSVPPTSPLYASYTHCDLSSTELTGLFVAGFEHMESLWPRGYRLASNAGLYNVSTNTSTVVDPTVDDSTFSVRPPQTAFLVGCISYVFNMMQWQEAAAHAVMTREKLAVGVQVDRTRQPEGYRALLEVQERSLKNLMDQAVADAGVSNFATIGPRTDWLPNVYATTIPVTELSDSDSG